MGSFCFRLRKWQERCVCPAGREEWAGAQAYKKTELPTIQLTAISTRNLDMR